MNIPSNIPAETWREIVKSVREGKCILFLGSMASVRSPERSPFSYTKAPPGGSELSESLAKECKYSDKYPNEDDTNLQRVASYYEFKKGRSLLVQAIKKEICKTANKQKVEISPAFCMLAELPFPIVITTNYDWLFDQAFNLARTMGRREKNISFAYIIPCWMLLQKM